MACKICTMPERTEIENALFNLSDSNTLVSIAHNYDISLEDLKKHAIMHAPMGLQEVINNYSTALKDLPTLEATEDTSQVVTYASITHSMKLKEADMLMAVASEYMVTLKAVGRKVNEALADEDVSATRMISKQLVELYLGTGSEIRSTIKSVAELKNLINGPEAGGVGGLGMLALAIQKSASEYGNDRMG